MEQILKEMMTDIYNLGVSDEVYQRIQEYCDKIVAVIPNQISEDRATYSNEGSFIREWNACVEKITNG